ncbi:MAG: hypothetical protein HY332_21435 [Chloroflexi bacterium]|nr:hypothetical protein [Chloroflexota bacterium]
MLVAFWGYGTFMHPKPETFVAFALVSGGAGVFLSRRMSRTSHYAAVSLLVLSLSLTRIDILAALALPYLARWWRDRRKDDFVVGAFVALAAVFATAILARILARIHPMGYPPNTPPVQISHSLFGTVTGLPVIALLSVFFAPLGTTVRGQLRGISHNLFGSVMGLPVIALPLVFFAPVGAALLGQLRGRRFEKLVAADENILLLWPLAHFGMTLVLGRVDEVRIFFPFAGLLGMVVGNSLVANAGGEAESSPLHRHPGIQ